MTQLEAARQGVITEPMRRVAERESVTADWVRDEVARGRLVIPANVRHLAGSAGRSPRESDAPPAIASAPIGHPGATPRARYWVNQTVVQRAREIDAPDRQRGESAPKRLDPTGIGRLITTKI